MLTLTLRKIILHSTQDITIQLRHTWSKILDDIHIIPGKVKVALMCTSFGFFLFSIAFFTTSWMTDEDSAFRMFSGLWKADACGTMLCGTLTYSKVNGYHRAIQVTECMSFVMFLLALVSVGSYVGVRKIKTKGNLLKLFTGATLNFLGVVSSIFGYALFVASGNGRNLFGFGKEVGWSLCLAMAGTVLHGTAFLVLGCQIVQDVQ